MPITPDELARRFTYHRPTAEQAGRYARLREAARTFAQTVVELTPESREQSLAITHIEQAVSFANAAVARREEPSAGAEHPAAEAEDTPGHPK